MKKLHFPYIMIQAYSVLLLVTLFWAGCSGDRNQPEMFGKPLLELQTETGIDFVNSINDTGDVSIYDSDLIYAGGGVAAGDINNDGLVDLFFSGNQVRSRLYLNLGDFKFKDITDEAGIFNNGWSTGVVMADVNGDSFLDIYVCVTGFKQEENKRNLLFINNGDNTFTESAQRFGIDDNGASQMASFFDYDNDGDLDLFVVNQPDDISNTFELPFYLNPKLVDTLNCSQLYENIGNSFKNVTAESGIGYVNADGFQVSIADLNNDGYLDMYVNNDLLQPDFLFYNNGDKTFTEVLKSHMNVVPLFSMGSTISDFNNDGRLDVIATEMMPPSHVRRKNSMPHPDVEFYDYVLNKAFDSEQRSRNMLQIQNADGSFSEIGELANVSRTDWSWAALGCDFNNDGYQDLFISNGVKRDVFDQTYLALAFDDKEPQEFKYEHNAMELVKNMPVYPLTNYVFENNGDLTFKDRSKEWGMTQLAASQGAAYADLDNDGYVDLIVSNTDDLASIYRNTGAEMLENHFVKVRFVGDGMNTFSLGAKVTLHIGSTRQMQQLQSAQGWYSSSEPTLFFGLGNATEIDSLTVKWLSGKQEVKYRISADQTVILHEDHASIPPVAAEMRPSTMFKAVHGNLHPVFVHTEKDFIDFQRDKLIPKKLSREGPGLAVGDVNNDGLEDFFIAGASGQSGALYVQRSDGQFEEMVGQPWSEDTQVEQMCPLFIDLDGDGFLDLYVTSGSNEFPDDSPLLQDKVYFNRGGKQFVRSSSDYLPEMRFSKGVVRAIDINQDGKMDLFVGGRVRNKDYPAAPESYILINEGTRLVDQTSKWNKGLKDIGMVTDAVVTDINDDGKPDLILCGEWMPITVYVHTGNSLEDRTKDYGLDGTNGWWNSLILTDLTGDGKLDIVAGNYGLNSILRCTKEEPVVCFHDDFDDNGENEPILCHYRGGILAPYADRDLFTRTLPSFHKRFLTYRAYGEASIYDILTKEQRSNANKHYAYMFASSIFVQRDGRFHRSNLPNEAQVAPIYGMVSLDFDEDGNQDLFISGNTYSSFYEEGPMAALRGLILKGNGDGTFKTLRSDMTGISLNKDSKAVGLINNSGKGAIQLIVTNNNDAIDMFELQRMPNKNLNNLRKAQGGYMYNFSYPSEAR